MVRHPFNPSVFLLFITMAFIQKLPLCKSWRHVFVIFTTSVLAACAQTPSPNALSPDPKEQEALTHIEQLYLEGEYQNLLVQLQDEPLMQSGSLHFKTEARKYQAFSYCTLGDKPACRQQFQDLLEENPGYLLSQAENTHPVWGPIFATESRKIRSSRVWVKQE